MIPEANGTFAIPSIVGRAPDRVTAGMIRAIRLVLLSSLAVVLVAAGPQPPTLRLGDRVKPIRYSLRLSLDPAKDEFAGAAEIDLDIREATTLFWLNATGLTVESAKVVAAGQTQKASVESGGDDFVGITVPAPILKGPATLRLVWRGKVNTKARDGVFRVTQNGENYLATQFEPLAARKAFPCFDEPGFKVPWQITLEVPADLAVFSNAPVVSETPDVAGHKAVRFAETKPLPCYLVAFAIGPFEVVDAGKWGRKSTPIRVITPKGRKEEAKSAAKVIPELFTRLENYFDIPYAYEKLDSVAVPSFEMGGMENAGMITYADTLLLSNPERESADWREGLAEIAAHEMAHQWFGNLVTMAWWNDAWLNEAFATWMSGRVIREWKPEWKWEMRNLRDKSWAAQADGLPSARRIAQPAESKDDIANAFDTITYLKGGAVLGMFENSAGAAKFRMGVQGYLRKHAHQNARTEDFLAALSSATDPAMGRAFRSFLDQPGIPEISATLWCEGNVQPTVLLQQKRSQPLGSSLEAKTWETPVCLKYGIGGKVVQHCSTLKSVSSELPLAGARTCPGWLLPNAGASGYYRVNYPGNSLSQLLERGSAQLSAVEQTAILSDTKDLIATGGISLEAALNAVPFAAKSPHGDVVLAAVGIVAESGNQILPDELIPGFSRFVRKTFGAGARKLGWTSAPGDERETRRLRAALLPFVAVKGKDPDLGPAAIDLARHWLKDRNAVEPDMVQAVLNTAAYFGDLELFNQFRAAAVATKDPNEQQALLAAMGGFANPDIALLALEELRRTDFDLSASIYMLGSMLSVRETRGTAFSFITSHFDEIAPPGRSFGQVDLGAALTMVGQVFCTKENLEKEKAFFEPRVSKYTGGPRLLSQTIENIEQCIAKKEKHLASVTAFYMKY